MTENNKELKACKAEFEKWYENTPLTTIMYGAGYTKESLEWAFQAAYTLRHNEAPTGELPICYKTYPNAQHQAENDCKTCSVNKECLGNKPTGEIGELIKEIELRRLGWAIDSDITVKGQFLDDCKAQLQQAQKMREALEKIYHEPFLKGKDILVEGKYIMLDDFIVQVLNNKG